MGNPRLTNWLLLLIAAILVDHFYPDTAPTLWVVGMAVVVGYCIYALVKTYRQSKAEQAASQEKRQTMREYMAELNAVRAKYDPNDEWNEATSLPVEYLREVRDLRDKYGLTD